MPIVAKFTCASVTDYGGSEEVKFHAAHGPGNESWSKATPGGNLQVSISNPAARGQFEPGKSYLLTIDAATVPVSPLGDKEAALMRQIVPITTTGSRS